MGRWSTGCSLLGPLREQLVLPLLSFMSLAGSQDKSNAFRIRHLIESRGEGRVPIPYVFGQAEDHIYLFIKS
jgi:hypothetical protein